MTASSEPTQNQNASTQVIILASVLPVLGFVMLVLFSIDSCCFFRMLGIGGLLAGAAFGSGALLGLLFGIPRISRSLDKGLDQSAQILTNNNLIEISDWLTKALVGVTLTQLSKLPYLLAQFGDRFGSDMGSSSAAIAILIHFSVSGFLAGYLLARIILPPMLHRAEKIPKEEAKNVVTIKSEPTEEVSSPNKNVSIAVKNPTQENAAVPEAKAGDNPEAKEVNPAAPDPSVKEDTGG